MNDKQDGLREEFEKEFGWMGSTPKDRRDLIADWWVAKLAQQQSKLVEKIEGLKGWENCIKGKETHGKCPACAERRGINNTADDAVAIIKEGI